MDDLSNFEPGAFGGWELAKAGTVDVAPLGPIFSETNHSVSAGVHDGVVGDSGLPDEMGRRVRRRTVALEFT